jgi:hypothetical protein
MSQSNRDRAPGILSSGRHTLLVHNARDAPLVKRGQPTTLDCLRCQLLGKRKLLCSRADACREIPMFLPLGPLLLLGWAVTVVAFVLATK